MAAAGGGRAWRPGRLAWLLLLPPAAWLALFWARPLWAIVRQVDGQAWRWLQLPSTQEHLRTAFVQAGLSTLLAVALAIPVVWLHHRYRIRGGPLALAVHAAPFVLPVFVVVYGLQGTVFGLHAAFADPLLAVVVANAFYNYGFAARLALSHLERRPRRLEEAARLLGASPARSFARTTLALLGGPLASVAVLVFLWCFASFGVVQLLGRGDVHTPETLMYRSLGGLFPKHGRAATLALVQLATGAALLALAFAARRRVRLLPAEAPPPKRASRAATAAAWALAALPMVPLASAAAQGFRVRGSWTLEPWRAILDPAHPGHAPGFDLRDALANSLLYAGASTALALALCACLAYGARTHPWLRRTAEALASLTLGASGLLLGFGLLLTYGAGSAWDLRATREAVVLTHTLLAFPFVCRVLLPAFAAVDPRQEEAARLLGASGWSVARRVHLRLLQAPLWAAAGFALALSLGDLGSSLWLMRPEHGGLAYWVNAHRVPFVALLQAQSAALAGLLGALALGAYALTQRAGAKVRL